MSDNGKPPICGGADEERWLPVVGYEGLYAVSDHGRVRSLDRTGSIAAGPRRGKILALSMGGSAARYPTVNLYRDGIGRSRMVHQIVIEAFVGPMPSDANLVRHLDDTPTNNRVENLVYGNDSQNRYDSVRNGTHRKTKLTHCKRGHPLSGPNVNVRHRSGGDSRNCRSCEGARAFILKRVSEEDMQWAADQVFKERYG